ncbi:helix-turn-helix domain-containing protein [Aurantivibrio infirmus]
MDLKELRVSRHLSQEELAIIPGLNVRTIQRIERGRQPSLESLKCIASALEIDFSTLSQEKQMSIKNLKIEIIVLLITGVVFVVYGVGAVARSGADTSSPIGATFFIAAAFCFLVAAFKMHKNKIGVFTKT